MLTLDLHHWVLMGFERTYTVLPIGGVHLNTGLFEGVEVQLGPRIGEFYPVLKGLEPGEKVAAAGAFLIRASSPRWYQVAPWAMAERST